MSLKQQNLDNSEEAIKYICFQKKRERDLIAKKEKLKQRMNRIEGFLKLLEISDDNLTCMIVADNLYQLSTVRQFKKILLTSLTACMQPYLKLHRRLLQLQEAHSVL